jgi:hypothetical protein
MVSYAYGRRKPTRRVRARCCGNRCEPRPTRNEPHPASLLLLYYLGKAAMNARFMCFITITIQDNPHGFIATSTAAWKLNPHKCWHAGVMPMIWLAPTGGRNVAYGIFITGRRMPPAAARQLPRRIRIDSARAQGCQPLRTYTAADKPAQGVRMRLSVRAHGDRAQTRDATRMRAWQAKRIRCKECGGAVYEHGA